EKIRFQVLQSARGRAFQARDPVTVSSGAAISLAAGDLDGDGLADVTVTSARPQGVGQLTVLLNSGTGPGNGTAYPLRFVPLGHRLGDLDQDGALDVVVYGEDMALVLFDNPAPGLPELFRRGDVDGDRAVEITDTIAILDRLFLGARALDCPDAADGNDDGEIDLSDAIAILSRLFLG